MAQKEKPRAADATRGLLIEGVDDCDLFPLFSNATKRDNDGLFARSSRLAGTVIHGHIYSDKENIWMKKHVIPKKGSK